MLSRNLIMPLGLWVATADAFFAFCPSWHKGCEVLGSEAEGNGATVKARGRPPLPMPGVITFELGQRAESDTMPHLDKVAREVAHVTKKFSRLRPRDNVYEMEPAVEPTREYAVGIDQDGTDFSYFAQVKFGSNKKTLYMLTDTGAGTSWVMSSSCTSTACGLHNSFGPTDSTSLKQSNDQFSIGYSTGSVKGNVVSDTVSVAGLNLNFQFGLANEITNDFAHFPFDGIIGLARNSGRTKAFLDTIKSAKALTANIFCFYLSRASDGPNVGELSLGAANPDKFEGDITYTSLIDSKGDWIVPVDGVSYNGQHVVDSMPAYMDTGTTYMFGPPETVTELHSAIPGAESSDNVTWTVPCDLSSSPSLVLSGVNFPISKEDWLSPPNNGLCTSNIYGIEVLSGSWLIGGTFLKNVYAIFDNDNARIGFAKKVIPRGSISSIPTKTSMSSTGSRDSPITTSVSSETTVPSLGLTGGEPGHPTKSAGDPSAPTGDSSAPASHHSFITSLVTCIIASYSLMV